MTSRDTPSRPFPSRAIFSLDARPKDEAGAPSLPTTLVVTALTEMASYTAVYLDRFGTVEAIGSEDVQRGQTMVVRGPHGSGKTHAVGFLMNRVLHHEIPRGKRVQDVLVLYAKADGPGLEGIYRSLMKQIPTDKLRELALRFTAGVAADTFAASGRDAMLVAELRARLRERPELVGTMLRDYSIDESALRQRRDEEIGRLTGESTDFINAFGWIDSELGVLAYRWIVGEQLDAGELRRLGVGSAIDTPETARFGIQLLAGVCRTSDTALIVIVDQYEKLVLDARNKPDRTAAGIVNRLAEVVPREDAMIVFVGNEEAWASLAPDVKQRFGRRDVQCRGVDLREAAWLVNVYLRPRDEAIIDRELRDDDIQPFTLDGLGVLHVYSGGNPRQLLELCAAAYDANTPGGTIGRDEARAAADGVGAERVDAPMALEAVRRLAESRGYAVSPSDAGAGADGQEAGLRLSVDGRDRFEVVIGQSAHYYDEVLDARGERRPPRAVLNNARSPAAWPPALRRRRSSSQLFSAARTAAFSGTSR